ncbi:MAG: DNA-binding protein [Firmicutes bacterium]|nr:DNA-binding protein [Bacillota bacterium]
MEYVSAKQTAQKWGISERRVQTLCEQGRIEGVFRLGRAWAIPQDAKKPEDARVVTGRYKKTGCEL